jgi:hypothetical protein
MYGTGAGTTVAGGLVGAGALATTGAASILLAVIGLFMVLTGLLLVRAVAVRHVQRLPPPPEWP